MPFTRCFAFPPKVVPFTTAPVPLRALAVPALAGGRCLIVLVAATGRMNSNSHSLLTTTATEGRTATAIIAVSFQFFLSKGGVPPVVAVARAEG